MPFPQEVNDALVLFDTHYRDRLGTVQLEKQTAGDGGPHECCLTSNLLRPGNYPKILHHGKKTEDVLVLTHGLSDSPHYVEAIGRRFFAEGINVILPLLPAHGLRDPDAAMDDDALDSKWKETIDNAVEMAEKLGARVSLGGFSTGGALSLNRVLRRPDSLDGGLFLFSAAVDLGLKDVAGRFGFIRSIVRLIEGPIRGIGRDPYKYPELPTSAGVELSQIIKENDRLWKGRILSQPVFAAHSMHDTTVKLKGVLELLEHHVETGNAFIISDNVSHSSLVLEKNIELDDVPGAPDIDPPQANPRFEWMMDNAVRFFREQVAAC